MSFLFVAVSGFVVIVVGGGCIFVGTMWRMMTMNHVVFEYIKVNLNCFASILLYTHKTCSIALPALSFVVQDFTRSRAHAHSLSVYRLRRVKRVSLRFLFSMR